MGVLPPIEYLLQPPRRSNDGVEWSRAHGERPCCVELPKDRKKKRGELYERHPLAPLRSSRRAQAVHVPLCVLPKQSATTTDYLEPHKTSSRPIPLSARVVRELAFARANEQRNRRVWHMLTPNERLELARGAAPLPQASAAAVPPVSIRRLHALEMSWREPPQPLPPRPPPPIPLHDPEGSGRPQYERPRASTSPTPTSRYHHFVEDVLPPPTRQMTSWVQDAEAGFRRGELPALA
jgi:hypothetical protein